MLTNLVDSIRNAADYKSSISPTQKIAQSLSRKTVSLTDMIYAAVDNVFAEGKEYCLQLMPPVL